MSTLTALENTPDSVLATIPIATPPPGIVPNFVHPEKAGTSFVVFGGVIVPVMLAFFGIRIYTKLFIIRQRSWDDWTCAFAAFGAILYYICVCLALLKGNYGKHEWDTSLLDVKSGWFAVPIYVLTWLSSVVLPFTKITFLIFYIQLFQPLKWLRILCYVGIGFTSVVFLGFLIAQLVLTTPYPGEPYIEMNFNPQVQIILADLSIPITATSFGIDIYIFTIPLLGVAKLQLSHRRKLGVVLIFLTGSSACVASFLSLYYKIVLNNNLEDPLWGSVQIDTTLLAEMTVGVIAASMPSLAKFARNVLPDFGLVDSAYSIYDRAVARARDRLDTKQRSHRFREKRCGAKKPAEESKQSLTKAATGERAAQDIELGFSSNAWTEITSKRSFEPAYLERVHI